MAPLDPIEEAADGDEDLYDIATWEPRTSVDRFSVWLHGVLRRRGQIAVVFVALAIVIAEFAIVGVALVTNPTLSVFALLSVLPAFGIALYVWRADVTDREPLRLLVVTFLLGFLLSGFAAFVNTVTSPLFEVVPWVGMILYFFLVVAPIEETVKWLAIRLYAYRSEEFSAVIDGAVYGAIAGLGFATIENTIYIGGQYLQTLQAGGSAGVAGVIGTAAARTFAGPGHVLYSAFAGYYLGLAKFTPEYREQVVVKGLFVATVLHATYNATVTNLGTVLDLVAPGLDPTLGFLGFVVVYDGAIGYALYRKISRYRSAYRRTNARDDGIEEGSGEPTETEGDSGTPTGEGNGSVPGGTDHE